MKALFSQKVINGIEKDIGCKIKVEEKFIIVSGKDRLILAKGVDAVHKVKEEGNKKDSSSSHVARSKSPERSPVATRFTRSDSQRSNHSPQTASLFQQRFGKQEKAVEDDVREDLKKLSRSSPKGRDCAGYMYGIHVDMVIHACSIRSLRSSTVLFWLHFFLFVINCAHYCNNLVAAYHCVCSER